MATQQANLNAADRLREFRGRMYGCLRRRGDALFELCDALLAAGPVPSLPHLSCEPVFRRSHGMIYQGLAKGRLDTESIRDALVAHRPTEWPLVFGVDSSTVPRPYAQTSPDREFHHHSCAGHTGGDPVIKGWSWQWLSQLNFDADSWTAPQDARRVTRTDAAAVTVAQIIAHAARLREHGETGVPLYVMDAGYDEAPITHDLGGHLDRVQLLIRVRNDRVLYRDPPPRPAGRPGRPRRHSADRFRCIDPASWGEPDQTHIGEDDRYGTIVVMSWGGLHPKLFCRGRFADFAASPIVKAHLLRVTVERLPNGRAVPGPLWLWWTGPDLPDLALCARAYLHRFDLEHTYRFAKTALNWADPALRHPDQFDRWTWIVVCALTQLRLARSIAQDHPHPWERRRRPSRLTPGRVRRDFARLLVNLGTQASTPKPSKAGPGRPKGRTSTPAPRHDVIKKAA